MAWIRLGGCCLVYSPILRSRRSQILGFQSLDYQIQEDTQLAILLVKYRSLSYLDCTPLGAQKSCSVYRCNFAATSYTGSTLKTMAMVIVSPILPPPKRGYFVLHEPPLIKTCSNVKQFVKQPLYLNYPNHSQPVERAVKLTTTPIAGSKKPIGEALCVIVGRKKHGLEKILLRRKKSCSCQSIKSKLALLLANCIFSVIHHFIQRFVLKLEKKC